MTRTVMRARKAAKRKAAKRKRQPSEWVLTPREAADALSMGINQVYEAIRTKRIPSFRFAEDGKIYIPRKRFEQMFAAGE